MDLKAAGDPNSRFDRLTRAGMAVCFLAASTMLIATLAVNELHDGQSFGFSLPVQLRSN
ncbi:MAG: hypothetical protein JSR99_09340 [Proteobacteria bacterium]|nr:hypothetical protein [Pseudomonadota bacterium]